MCKNNKITLNPAKFCVSRKIKVGGFKISSDDTDPNTMIKPSRLAVNKVLESQKLSPRRTYRGSWDS